MKALLILAFSAALLLCGCEEGDDTVINEAPDINTASNNIVLIDKNTGTVVVDQTTSEAGDDPSIIISGNTGKVYVVTRPYVPSEPEEVEP